MALLVGKTQARLQGAALTRLRTKTLPSKVANAPRGGAHLRTPSHQLVLGRIQRRKPQATVIPQLMPCAKAASNPRTTLKRIQFLEHPRAKLIYSLQEKQTPRTFPYAPQWHQRNFEPQNDPKTHSFSQAFHDQAQRTPPGRAETTRVSLHTPLHQRNFEPQDDPKTHTFPEASQGQAYVQPPRRAETAHVSLCTP